jgi:hypothetical protein
VAAGGEVAALLARLLRQKAALLEECFGMAVDAGGPRPCVLYCCTASVFPAGQPA